MTTLLAEMQRLAATADDAPAEAERARAERLRRAAEGVDRRRERGADHRRPTWPRRSSAASKSVTLPEVMIALQKASLSFQAMTEVRNRLVNAYQEIMNMPI